MAPPLKTQPNASRPTGAIGKRAQRIMSNTRWPNVQEWALLGFFGMTFYLLDMVRQNPALLGVPSFMQFASQLVGGGLLLAAAWLYSAGKKEGDAGTTTVTTGTPPDQTTVTTEPPK